MPYSVIGGLKRFVGTCLPYIRGRIEPEVGVRNFRQNIHNHVLDYITASYRKDHKPNFYDRGKLKYNIPNMLF